MSKAEKYIESPHKAKEVPLKSYMTTVDKLEDSIGTLSDRAIAATQYQMLENSFKKHCSEEDMTDNVKTAFKHMARHLATIGTNVDPNDVTTPMKEGLPLGWGLK